MDGIYVAASGVWLGCSVYTAPAVETNYRVKRVVHMVTTARSTACGVMIASVEKCDVFVGSKSAEAAATCIFV